MPDDRDDGFGSESPEPAQCVHTFVQLDCESKRILDPLSRSGVSVGQNSMDSMITYYEKLTRSTHKSW